MRHISTGVSLAVPRIPATAVFGPQLQQLGVPNCILLDRRRMIDHRAKYRTVHLAVFWFSKVSGKGKRWYPWRSLKSNEQPMHQAFGYEFPGENRTHAQVWIMLRSRVRVWLWVRSRVSSWAV